MNHNHVALFLDVVEQGSINGAARIRNVAQSAVSRIVRELELTHGVRLLDRHTWGTEPTDAGKVLADLARTIRAEANVAQKELDVLKARPGGRQHLVRTVELLQPSRRRRGEVKQAIRAAGGLPFEVRTAAPSDFITSVGLGGGYILPTRDLIAADIEVQVEGARLDGMVCLASCDKTTPGQLMAAARLNIPSIVVICGYQQSGQYKGEHIDIEEVFLRSSSVPLGKITVAELGDMADQAVRSPGVCAGMGTANSMHILCEALGMALPGSAPVQANSAKMKEYVQQAGARIVQMVWDDVKPRDIISAASVANATMVTLALSGSINCVKHLQAIAIEAGVEVDVYGLFAEYADRFRCWRRCGPMARMLIEELEEAGGARAVMKRLERFIRKEARSVSGQTIDEILEECAGQGRRHHPLGRQAAIDAADDQHRARLAPPRRGHRAAGRLGRAPAPDARRRQHLPFARRSARRHQGRQGQIRRRGGAARARRHRRTGHGDDLGGGVRARRRRPHRRSGRHHRGTALGPGQSGLGGRRGLARGGGPAARSPSSRMAIRS